MAKKLTDEFLKWTLDIDGKPAMAALNSMEQQTKLLQKANQGLYAEMAKLEAQGKKQTDEYKALNQQYITNNQTISQAQARMAQLRGEIGLNSLTADQLRQRMNELRRAMDQSTPNSAAWTQHQRDLTAVTTRYNQVRAAAGNTQSVFGQLTNGLSGMQNPIGGVISGLVQTGKAMWALVTNPVGAFIAALVLSLTLLYKAWTSTDEGAVAMEGTLKAIGNTMDILLDRAMNYYKMLWSLVTFDWEGVKKNGKDAFGGLGAAVRDATNAGWEYAKSMDDIADREAAAQIRMSKLKVDIETLKNSSKDANKTSKEKMDLAQQAMDKEIELNGIEKGFLTERNATETMNLASKIQNNKLTMAQKEAQLKQWLEIDDKELASAMAKDAAFAEFENKNEEAFQALQKKKSEEFDKDAQFQSETRRLQKTLSSEMVAEKLDALEASNSKELAAIKNRRVKELTTETQYNNELMAQDLKFATQKLSLYQVGSKEYEALRADIEDKHLKSLEEVQKQELKNLDIANQKKNESINSDHLSGKLSEAQYNSSILQQEFDYLAAKRDIYKKGSKEYEDADAELKKKQVEAAKNVKDLLLSAEKELANAKISNLTEALDIEKAKEEEQWQERQALLKKQISVEKNMSADKIKLNQTLNDTILEEQKAHDKKMSDLNEASEIKSQMDDALFDKAKAKSNKKNWDADEKIAKAQYKQELLDANGNATKIAQAERNLSDKIIDIKNNELDERQKIGDAIFNAANNTFGALVELVGKESALGKALFLLQQAAAIGQIIFNTSIANAKAVAASPLTAGQPWVTINTVSAAASIASVVAQGINDLNGKQSGGYADSDTDDSKPKGIYHANEFIASGPAVRNPTVKPILDIIDIAQRTGTIKSLNLAGIISGGRQSGGYASQSSSLGSANTLISGRDPELTRQIGRLADHLDKGINAKVSAYGGRGTIGGEFKVLKNLLKSIDI